MMVFILIYSILLFLLFLLFFLVVRYKEKIDATGMCVSPGFIDTIGQSYKPFLFGDGKAISKVAQGITMEIMGEGFSPAPFNENYLDVISSFLPL